MSNLGLTLSRKSESLPLAYYGEMGEEYVLITEMNYAVT